MTTPDICNNCGGRVFRKLHGLQKRSDENKRTQSEKVFSQASEEAQNHLTIDGFECVECGEIQLHREIPPQHADDNSLDLPDSADRDMVREE